MRRVPRNTTAGGSQATQQSGTWHTPEWVHKSGVTGVLGAGTYLSHPLHPAEHLTEVGFFNI